LTPKKLNNKRTIILLTVVIALIAGSCSTKKNTWTHRAYHSVTCHYNVFWHGKMSLIEGTNSLEESIKNNYNEILRVYNYGTKEEAKQLYPKMDRAIKKSSIAIQKHSMYFGGEQRIKWVKESYLLMGKAHFLKQDYVSARRVFDYVAKEYNDDPISFEGYLWLAKTYIETERFEKAEATLNLMQSRMDENKAPRNVQQDLPLVQADFYIATKKYDDAYPYLERAIELGNDRDLITRAYFILGQIDQQDGDLERATANYKKVIKRNPYYVMDFQARINMAQCYDEGTGDSKNINKVLEHMVKDFKNKEFLDQIYYALAEVAFKDGKTEKGIEFLRLSVSSSTNNNYQKTTSSLDLADLYFARNEYNNAQAYYDTAVQFLPEDYPNHEIIKNKAGVLSEMVMYSQTITLQDSLQKLASMDSTELYAVIDGVIENYKKEKERKKEEIEAVASEGGTQFVDLSRGGTQQQSLGGKWYFYNTQAMSMGLSAFKQKWGNRKLEDYWRLTDKRTLLQSGGDELAQGNGEGAPNDSTQSANSSSDPENRAFYLVNIPGTEEEIQKSDSLIIEAYNKLGFLYLEELNDTVNALENYLTFQDKYPDNRYRLESWYALYKIYNEKGDTEKATHYKDLIVGNFPDSDYARVILDPDYYIKQAEGKNKAAKLYEKAFDAYEKGLYYRVINIADLGVNDFPNDTAYVPKFKFLRAVSIGKVNVPDTLFIALNELVTEYPNSSVTPRAQSILKILRNEYGIGMTADTSQVGSNPADQEISPYKFDPKAKHLFMIVVLSPDIEIDPLKVRVSKKKKKYFRLERLNIKSLLLDNQRTLITIGNFADSETANNFYTAIKSDEYVFSGMKSNEFEIYTISLNNYPVFYRDKSMKVYRDFYNKYYSNFGK